MERCVLNIRKHRTAIHYVVILVFTSMCFTSGAQPQDVLEEMPQEDLLGIAFRNNTEAFAVGKKGAIKKIGLDGTAVNIYSGVGHDLYDIYFFDESNAIIAGATGSFGSNSLRTTDGGVTWSPISGVSGTLIAKINSSTAIITGDVGTSSYWKTTDKGATWTPADPLPAFFDFRDIDFVHENLGFVTATRFIPESQSRVTETYKSSDKGDTWTLAGAFTGPTVVGSIRFLSETTGVFIENNGPYTSKIYRTTNGGANWNLVLSANYLINDVHFNNNVGFAVGAYQKTGGAAEHGGFIHQKLVLRSTDAGQTWEIIDDPLFEYSPFYEFHKLASFGTKTILAGTSSRVFVSDDDGISWQNLLGFGSVNTLYFFDDNNGIAAGDGIYTTHDGGHHWKIIRTNKGAYEASGNYYHGLDANKIVFADENTGYIAGGSGETGIMLKTTDAGVTWSPIHSRDFPYWDILLFDKQKGVVLTSDLSGYRCAASNDGFANISYSAVPNFYGYASRGANAFWFLNSTVGFGVGGTGDSGDKRVFKTSDGGFTWVEKFNAGRESSGGSIYFKGQRGFFITGRGLIAKTFDGGETWSNNSKIVNEFLNDVEFKNDMEGYIVGDASILKTSNGGTSWSIFFTPPADDFGLYYLRSILFVNNIGYIAAEKRFFKILSKESQTIAFDPVSDRTEGDAPFELSATASSGLPVSYISESENILLSGNSVSILAPGRASITATQRGDAHFVAAQEVTRSFCVNPGKPSLTLEGNHTETPVLTSSSPEGNQWYRNGSLIPGEVYPTISATEPGIYSVKVLVDNCASEESTPLAMVVTGIAGEGPAGSSILYPNPVDESLNIDLCDYSTGDVSLTILNANGVSIVRVTVEGGKTTRLSTVDLQAGFYLLRVRQNQKTLLIKFVKK